jgi:hypothetical protein
MKNRKIEKKKNEKRKNMKMVVLNQSLQVLFHPWES